MIISIIVAATTDGIIGKNNTLPWKISSDMKRFRQYTTGKCIIMGRKTFESIGKSLPNRKNIVITRNNDFRPEGVEVVSSPEDALLSSQSQDEVFIIGGSEIYKQFLPIASKIYMTIIRAKIDGDASFPIVLDDTWELMSQVDQKADGINDEYDTSFCIFEKVKLKKEKENNVLSS